MCSCSGSCNCNSTTIPKGPQGAQGQAATITAGSATALPLGATPTVTNSGSSSAAVFNFGIPTGATGDVGPAGVNAYTTLTEDFVQPAVNALRTMNVVNSAWLAVGQIIYIGAPAGVGNPGGFYKINFKPAPGVLSILNLGWTVPGVTFVAPDSPVGSAGTLVTSAGTKGADGANGSGITLIKSIPNILNGSSKAVTPDAAFTLTQAPSPVDFVFKSVDFCPNVGDVGRITFEGRCSEGSFSSPASNISLDMYLGVSGVDVVKLTPYTDTGVTSGSNTLESLIWGGTSSTISMYIKYTITVQRINNTTVNILVDWTASSAGVKVSGTYNHDSVSLPLTGLDFTNSTQFLEISIKGFNNSTVSVSTFSNCRLYIESLRQLPA